MPIIRDLIKDGMTMYSDSHKKPDISRTTASTLPSSGARSGQSADARRSQVSYSSPSGYQQSQYDDRHGDNYSNRPARALQQTTMHASQTYGAASPNSNMPAAQGWQDDPFGPTEARLSPATPQFGSNNQFRNATPAQPQTGSIHQDAPGSQQVFPIEKQSAHNALSPWDIPDTRDDAAPPPYSTSSGAIDDESEHESLASGKDDPSMSHVDPQTDEELEHQIQKHLTWARSPSKDLIHRTPKLSIPVAIPQVAPGLQQSFSRAWSPSLAAYDIRPEEFLEFMDHLNICKAATPPLQVMNLAGNILGFTPIPYATLVGIGTQAASAAGMFAVAKIRIARYLTRANEQYFIPRGLHVRVAKQAILQQIVKQPDGAPLLAPQEFVPDTKYALRQRRLLAMSGYVAPLELEGLPTAAKEHNVVDKLSSKMMEFKTMRQNRKSGGNSDQYKGKLDEEMQKLSEERQKVQAEADEKMRSNPNDRGNVERHMQEELTKIQKDQDKAQMEYDKSSGSGQAGVSAEETAAAKFIWVVIEAANNVVPQPAMSQQGKTAAMNFVQGRLNRH